MLKTVMECDYCQEQEDWEDMQETAIPDGWEKIIISRANDENVSQQSKIIVICPKHNNEPLGTIIATCLS